MSFLLNFYMNTLAASLFPFCFHPVDGTQTRSLLSASFVRCHPCQLKARDATHDRIRKREEVSPVAAHSSTCFSGREEERRSLDSP
ncbi:hypothetical protein CDAR_72811 [Caerostris darwini]|uniref:Secreted protein n=1 Tax=Caerostris darwini TaxID=1538125 RepID=A0AAV4MM51_9ARAC|nr:hypothetical protein CDAR_72811 [Caerostris darwini]